MGTDRNVPEQCSWPHCSERSCYLSFLGLLRPLHRAAPETSGLSLRRSSPYFFSRPVARPSPDKAAAVTRHNVPPWLHSCTRLMKCAPRSGAVQKKPSHPLLQPSGRSVSRSGRGRRGPSPSRSAGPSRPGGGGEGPPPREPARAKNLPWRGEGVPLPWRL